jgi:signal peptidase I
MTGEEGNGRPGSPLLSVWLRPRKTIAQIVTTRTTRWVLLLAILGGMSAIASELVNVGLADNLLSWRGLPVWTVGAAALAVLNLYVTSYIAAWIGRMMSGQASAQAVRAALAWSQLPLILGFVVNAIMLGALHMFGTAPLASPMAIGGFNLILIGTGLWSFVLLLLMISRIQHFGFWQTIAVYLLGVVLPWPLLLAFSVRTLLFQPFSIPAVSMAPTLLVGDYMFANKFAYGYGRFTPPFGPWGFSGRIFASDPKVGDVVVFALPKDPSTTYVKRVVGLAGDRIQMRNGLLYINGTPVQRERLSDVHGDFCGTSVLPVKRWRETLPNGKSYETLDCVDNGFYDNTVEYVVPPGHAFMMGDNRDNSTDSRVLFAIGYIPLDNIYGRASMIFYSRVSNDRAGTMVR